MMLGETIKKKRKQKGLSLSKLARQAGVSKGYLSNIEQGNNLGVSVWIVKRIAQVLECTIDELAWTRSVTAYQRGHTCYLGQDDNWYYMDDDSLYEDKRRCPQCDCLPTQEGYDACLGKIEGAWSACCGHGVEDGYIVWEHLVDLSEDDKQ